MRRVGWAVLLPALVTAGCAPLAVRFPNATPGRPLQVPAAFYRPAAAGPVPAVVLLPGCHGVSPSTHDWARWLGSLGYAALVVDSWAARGFQQTCTPWSPDPANTERFDDAVGALRWLSARPEVEGDRVAVMGWSNGGVFALALVNGPSLERARARGVRVPGRGFRAAVGLYPGGCLSLVDEVVVRPLLLLLGQADDWTAPGPCLDMAARMRDRGADVTAVLYPGAVHYFDVAGLPRTVLPDVTNRNRPGQCCGATVGYDAAAAADARRRVREFLGRHLAGPAVP